MSTPVPELSPALSIEEVSRCFAAGTLSSEELVTSMLGRIAAHNPRLNAFITVLHTRSLEEARTLDEERRRGHTRGVLHGIPISIKDLIDVEGTPTTAASHVREGHMAQADAPVVARLRQAGAIIIGKCNLHEFALGTTSDESAFGAAHNPFDERRSPGGSSGGSAIAVAACMSSASIGTDTGGSIRIPAAACGVVGLKPSYGEISTVGVVPLSTSLDHVGPLTRTVGDAWTLYDVLTGGASARVPPTSLRGLRLGRLGGYFVELLSDGVRKRFDEAIARLQEAGVALVDVHLHHAPEIPSVYVNIVLPEAYAYHAKTLETAPEGYSEGVRSRLVMGRDVPAREFARAQNVRTVLREEVDAALAGCDALVLPTMPIPAPLLGVTTVRMGHSDEGIRPLMLRLTQLFNLTGHPALSVPCGLTGAGLPCGLQLVGKRQATAELLSLALACEPYITPLPLRCAGDS
jgi:aspartyl-tRNA(Asn)/glutamyl-tRNA(Gln) amidotransferase subunit A